MFAGAVFGGLRVKGSGSWGVGGVLGELGDGVGVLRCLGSAVFGGLGVRSSGSWGVGVWRGLAVECLERVGSGVFGELGDRGRGLGVFGGCGVWRLGVVEGSGGWVFEGGEGVLGGFREVGESGEGVWDVRGVQCLGG